jgi:hypothetical protein
LLLNVDGVVRPFHSGHLLGIRGIRGR